MSAGAIPVVFGSAGPAEVVEGVEGIVSWTCPSQLAELTGAWVAGPRELEEVRTAVPRPRGAVRRARLPPPSGGADVTGDPVEAWPDECRRVVVVAPCVPEASGGARAAENCPDVRVLGLTVEVVSMYPGTRGGRVLPPGGHPTPGSAPVRSSGSDRAVATPVARAARRVQAGRLGARDAPLTAGTWARSARRRSCSSRTWHRWPC